MGSMSHKVKLTWQNKAVFSRRKTKNKEEAVELQSNIRNGYDYSVPKI